MGVSLLCRAMVHDRKPTCEHKDLFKSFDAGGTPSIILRQFIDNPATIHRFESSGRITVLVHNNCMSDAQILIADDMQTNRNVMKVNLGKIVPDRSVQLFDNAEALVQQDLSHAKVLIIDNHFGTDKMTGVEAVQLIRSKYDDDIAIALWSSGKIDDNPGADFIWTKTVSDEIISADLKVKLQLSSNSSTSA